MNSMTELLFIFSIGAAVAYIMLLALLSVGWINAEKKSPADYTICTKISVVIPARNEEGNIVKCIESIAGQNFPQQLLEIIVINDNSTDDTASKAIKCAECYPEINIRIISLNKDDQSGKKNAITKAVMNASGDLIVTVDADCVVGKNWLKEIAEHHQENNAVFISAPVFFKNENTVFEKLQSLEFMSLVASGAGSVNMRFPIMCNGANLAFGKKEFLEVGGYKNNLNYMSGDDMFLLIKMKKKYPGRVSFLKSYDASVFTFAAKSFNSFYNQRKRWVSKSKAYSDFAIISSAVIVYVFNLSILISSVAGIWNVRFLYLALSLLLTKAIADFPIIISISRFAKKTSLLYLYLPLQIVYVFYIVFFGFVGFFGRFSWKGRSS